MSAPRHEVEVDRNRAVWDRKPLLRDVYGALHARMVALIDRSIPGRVIEIGSGIGAFAGDALRTDSFVRPWLDLALDAYALPFRAGTLSHLIAFDVFHHLERPMAFLADARHALAPRGRVILVEPYISAVGRIVYGLLHPEPIAWRRPIDRSTERPPSRYYAAQGNATRMFFGAAGLGEWRVVHAEAFAGFAYLLSGGFSRVALYPRALRPALDRTDAFLSRWPSVFAARCLVVLERGAAANVGRVSTRRAD